MELENNNLEPVKITVSRNKAVFILVSSVVFYLVAVLLWGRQGLDSAFVIKQNFIFSNPLYLQAAKLISRYGMGVISLSLAVLLFITRSDTKHRVNQPIFLYIIISFAMASIAGDVMKEILDRARPAVELSGRILQTEVSASPSFPSGHATKSMALALPFLFITSNTGTITKIVKIITLLMALLVCYARIALQKHYLSDVLAGVATALFFLLIAVWAVNYFFRVRNIDEKKLFLMNGKIRIVFLALAVVLCMI